MMAVLFGLSSGASQNSYASSLTAGGSDNQLLDSAGMRTPDAVSEMAGVEWDTIIQPANVGYEARMGSAAFAADHAAGRDWFSIFYSSESTSPLAGVVCSADAVISDIIDNTDGSFQVMLDLIFKDSASDRVAVGLANYRVVNNSGTYGEFASYTIQDLSVAFSSDSYHASGSITAQVQDNSNISYHLRTNEASGSSDSDPAGALNTGLAVIDPIEASAYGSDLSTHIYFDPTVPGHYNDADLAIYNSTDPSVFTGTEPYYTDPALSGSADLTVYSVDFLFSNESGSYGNADPLTPDPAGSGWSYAAPPSGDAYSLGGGCYFQPSSGEYYSEYGWAASMSDLIVAVDDETGVTTYYDGSQSGPGGYERRLMSTDGGSYRIGSSTNHTWLDSSGRVLSAHNSDFGDLYFDWNGNVTWNSLLAGWAHYIPSSFYVLGYGNVDMTALLLGRLSTMSDQGDPWLITTDPMADYIEGGQHFNLSTLMPDRADPAALDPVITWIAEAVNHHRLSSRLADGTLPPLRSYRLTVVMDPRTERWKGIFSAVESRTSQPVQRESVSVPEGAAAVYAYKPAVHAGQRTMRSTLSLPSIVSMLGVDDGVFAVTVSFLGRMIPALSDIFERFVAEMSQMEWLDAESAHTSIRADARVEEARYSASPDRELVNAIKTFWADLSMLRSGLVAGSGGAVPAVSSASEEAGTTLSDLTVLRTLEAEPVTMGESLRLQLDKDLDSIKFRHVDVNILIKDALNVVKATVAYAAAQGHNFVGVGMAISGVFA
jgi:hypothetical protein